MIAYYWCHSCEMWSQESLWKHIFCFCQNTDCREKGGHAGYQCPECLTVFDYVNTKIPITVSLKKESWIHSNVYTDDNIHVLHM